MKTLVFALNGSGYKELCPGTYEEAVELGDGSASGDNFWAHGELNEQGKYEFMIDVTDCALEGEVIPVVAVSNSYYQNYLNGTNELARAFYPRQIQIDLENATLVSGDYDNTVDIELSKTGSAENLPIESAAMRTIGGPNSNNYSVVLGLTMTNADYDQYFIGAAEDATEESSFAINENNKFGIEVRANAMGGSTTVNYLGQDTTISFHNSDSGEWEEYTMNVVKDTSVSFVGEVAPVYCAFSIQVRKVALLVDPNMSQAANDSATIVIKDSEGNVIDDETIGAYKTSNGMYRYGRLLEGETYTVEVSIPGWELVRGNMKTTDQGVEHNYWDGNYHWERINQEVYTTTVTGDAEKTPNLIVPFIKKENPALPELQAALAATPEDLSIFTTETAAAVETAKEKADLDEEDEATMRKAAQDLLSAVQGLIPKDGTYTTTIEPSKPAGIGYVQSLVVNNGVMTARVMLKTTSYSGIYMGTKDAAAAATEGVIEVASVEPNPNNSNKDANVFAGVPVEAFATPITVAFRSAKYGTFSSEYTWTFSAKDLVAKEADPEPEPEATELTVENKTGMFKVATAKIVTDTDGSKSLEFTIASTSYSYFYVGTYEEALENGDNRDNWIAGETIEGGLKYVVPLSDDVTYMPLQAISKTKLANYDAGTAELSAVFYSRQFEIDYDNHTITTNDYLNTKDIALENKVSSLPVESAAIDTVGGPTANGYKKTLVLSMNGETFTKAYVGSAKDAASAADVIALNDDNAFEIIVVKNLKGGIVDYNYLDQDIAVSFYNNKTSAWVECVVNVSDENAKATINKAAALKGTWKKDSKGWWYQYEDKSYPKSCWAEIDGARYYFDGNGYMVTGWKSIDGCWYYFKSSGAVSTGWTKVGSTWYYLDPSTGIMQTGWILNKTYYMKSSGAMATGWNKIGGYWYYFNTSGAKITKSWVSDKYYMDAEGKMVTYCYVQNGTKYYWVNKDGEYVAKWTTTKKSDTNGYKVYNQKTGLIVE